MGPKRDQPDKSSRMPSDSVFYDKVIPVLFVILGIILVVVIGFSIGVLTGLIPWQ